MAILSNDIRCQCPYYKHLGIYINMNRPLHSLTNIEKRMQWKTFTSEAMGAIRRIQITASFCILAFKRLYDKMYDDDAPP